MFRELTEDQLSAFITFALLGSMFVSAITAAIYRWGKSRV